MGPRSEISGEPADGGRRPAPSAVDDEQDGDAEERRGRGDRAQDHHELTRTDGPARTDRGQRRRRSATEPRKPRYAGPRDRAAERTSRVHGRKWSARPIGSERSKRSGTSAATAKAVPNSAPRAAKATAFAPWPTRRRRCPGSVASAVSSVGAPKKTAGMKSKTAWLPAVARRKHESKRPIVSGSEETSGTSAARNPVHAAWVASTRAATLFT